MPRTLLLSLVLQANGDSDQVATCISGHSLYLFSMNNNGCLHMALFVFINMHLVTGMGVLKLWLWTCGLHQCLGVGGISTQTVFREIPKTQTYTNQLSSQLT